MNAEVEALLQGLKTHMPVALTPFDAAARRTGLVIVDEVNGFATVGAGPLAPPEPNPQVSRMVAETDRLARRFAAEGWPIAAFLDTQIVENAQYRRKLPSYLSFFDLPAGLIPAP